MQIRTRNQKTPNSSQEKLREIGRILLSGICRLEAKERSQNSQILLDNKPSPSLHSIDSNLNQQFML